MIYKFLFLICTLMIITQDWFITNKIASAGVMIIASVGILFSLHKSDMSKTPKLIISGLCIIALITYFVVSYIF